MRAKRTSWWAGFIVLVAVASAAAQSVGPDVIVGDLNGVNNYGTAGNYAAFSVGTTSCNIGDTNLSWVSNTNQHPVIFQSLYRIKDGRITHIGQSWLKHGFLALAGNICSPCNGSGGAVLNPGCSDPYSAGLNGSQGGLGSKSEVNAATGFFLYPPQLNPPLVDGTSRRVRVPVTDLDTNLNVGASYVVEGQYITPDDSAAGNDDNNVSYRPVTVTGSAAAGNTYTLTFAGPTMQQHPAIEAWVDPAASPQDLSEFIAPVDVPSDGRFIVAMKRTSAAPGIYHYEFAVYNMNSDRSAQAVTINLSNGATITNTGFHDVEYHSGDPYSGIDWAATVGTNAITWSTTPYSTDVNANALRWGTLYSFWFDTSGTALSVDIDLFKPSSSGGGPNTVSVMLPSPTFSITFPNGVPATILPNTPTAVPIATQSLGGAPDPLTAVLLYSVDGGATVAQPLADLGGGNFQANLPGVPCFSIIDWSVSISPLGGGLPVTAPAGAPTVLNHTTAEGTLVAVADFDFQTSTGWTVVNGPGLTDGAWTVGVPAGGGDRGDPATDFDGSGACWLTDNVDGDSDVDGGATTLVSPAFDLAGLGEARIKWAMWYDNDFGPNGGTDVFQIDISDDGGQTWTAVETYNASVDQWVERSIRVTDFVSMTSQVQMRFTASDPFPGAIVEAGLDAFKVEICPDPPFLTGPAAAGNVGGPLGPENVLLINGIDGGVLRRVDVGLNQPIVVTMLSPSTNPSGSQFVIYGQFFVPPPGFSVTLPFGIGQMAMVPCELDLLNPLRFVFTSSWFPSNCGPGLVTSTPSPWVFLLNSGIPTPIVIMMQGVIFDPSAPLNIAVTNAVILGVGI